MIFKKDKLPKGMRNALKPRPEFAERTKVLFLSSFRQKFGAIPEAYRRMAARFIVPVLAIFSVINIGAVYADSQNVPATSPLYPLKKYHESVVLAFSGRYDRPKLELEFANRRIEEIKNLKILREENLKEESLGESTSMATSTAKIKKDEAEKSAETENKNNYYNKKIKDLTKELDKTLDNSIKEADSEDYPQKKREELCAPLGSIIQSQSPEVDNVIQKKPKVIGRFRECLDRSSSENNASGTISKDRFEESDQEKSNKEKSSKEIRPKEQGDRGDKER